VRAVDEERDEPGGVWLWLLAWLLGAAAWWLRAALAAYPDAAVRERSAPFGRCGRLHYRVAVQVAIAPREGEPVMKG
jgi:hypothetical protein